MLELVKEKLKNARDFENPEVKVQVEKFEKIMRENPKLWDYFLINFENEEEEFKEIWLKYLEKSGLYICAARFEADRKNILEEKKPDIPVIKPMIWGNNSAVIKIIY